MIWQWHNGIYRKARGWYSQLQEKGITKKIINSNQMLNQQTQQIVEGLVQETQRATRDGKYYHIIKVDLKFY